MRFSRLANALLLLAVVGSMPCVVVSSPVYQARGIAVGQVASNSLSSGGLFAETVQADRTCCRRRASPFEQAIKTAKALFDRGVPPRIPKAPPLPPVGSRPGPPAGPRGPSTPGTVRTNPESTPPREPLESPASDWSPIPDNVWPGAGNGIAYEGRSMTEYENDGQAQMQMYESAIRNGDRDVAVLKTEQERDQYGGI